MRREFQFIGFFFPPMAVCDPPKNKNKGLPEPHPVFLCISHGAGSHQECKKGLSHRYIFVYR